MEVVKYVFSGLKSLILSQIDNHKEEIEKLISEFVKSLISGLINAGHEDSVKKIQSLVAEHPES